MFDHSGNRSQKLTPVRRRVGNMETKRLTGIHAGAQKYDLLTAMAVSGLNGGQILQTSMLRLVALITARYNWRSDELTVGQREMARLWGVDERTVKREIKRLTETQILLQLRPGVKGRVAAYRLNYAEITRLSAPHWDRVGPDFSMRMGDGLGHQVEPPAEKVVRVDFRAARSGPSVADDPWGRSLARLAEADPVLHQNWFAGLTLAEFADGILRLNCPSAFIAQYIRSQHLDRIHAAALPDFSGLRRIILD